VGFCLIDGSELSSAETHARMNLAAALAGKYRVIRRLGEGSLGVVFLAEQLTAGRRRVALKVFRRQLLDDPDFTLHFERGMAVAGSIHHPNVVAVFEADQTADDTP
jgi:serine/threonine-protein kinase